MYNSINTINTLHKERNMPYTVTIVTTKPQGTAWWNAPTGSPDYIAREELFAWMAQQPGYLSTIDTPAVADVATVVVVFDTEANYTAYYQAMVLKPAAITRAEYNSAAGITSVVTAETT
jgi:hypothetical protein